MREPTHVSGSLTGEGLEIGANSNLVLDRFWIVIWNGSNIFCFPLADSRVTPTEPSATIIPDDVLSDVVAGLSMERAIQ